MSRGEIILYTTDDGKSSVQLRSEDETAWLNQSEIALLFNKGRSTISEHVNAIFSERELEPNRVCRNFRQTATDGKSYNVIHYNLDMILAIGYRVRSDRGVQFRRWATAHLSEYLVKGFVMNDARLKEPGGIDYFDEWLERIREIRASEKRFYQKVRDIYATSVDYDPKSEQAQVFFKKVQNKMLWAVTHHTAAELIVKRSNLSLPNMGLRSWKGKRINKQDVVTAKNYLNPDELKELNDIVVMYLDYAEHQAKQRKTMNMAQWGEKLDAFLAFNEKDLLESAGKVSAEIAEKLAYENYEQFDIRRREAEKIAADEQDLALLQNLQEITKKKC